MGLVEKLWIFFEGIDFDVWLVQKSRDLYFSSKEK